MYEYIDWIIEILVGIIIIVVMVKGFEKIEEKKYK